MPVLRWTFVAIALVTLGAPSPVQAQEVAPISSFIAAKPMGVKPELLPITLEPTQPEIVCAVRPPSKRPVQRPYVRLYGRLTRQAKAVASYRTMKRVRRPPTRIKSRTRISARAKTPDRTVRQSTGRKGVSKTAPPAWQPQATTKLASYAAGPQSVPDDDVRQVGTFSAPGSRQDEPLPSVTTEHKAEMPQDDQWPGSQKGLQRLPPNDFPRQPRSAAEQEAEALLILVGIVGGTCALFFGFLWLARCIGARRGRIPR